MMSDDPTPSASPDAAEPAAAAPMANVEHIHRWSPVWLVPLAAFGIAMWMVYQHYVGQGPLIQVRFENAEGIEPGKTRIRTKNVEVGEVLGMQLSEGAESVLLSVRIHKENAHLLREDSSFWIVRPRVNALSVTGLGTLLSGAYIEMAPGLLDKAARTFEGLDAPPSTPIGTPGLHIVLESSEGKRLHEGTPLMFGGMEAGKIEDVQFDPERRRTRYDAFIVQPYDRLITENTRFWFNSGVAVDVSADGARLEFGTLETIASGGVSFGVPEGQELGPRITVDYVSFEVYPHEGAIYERIYAQALEYILLADRSIRGLQPGAPVEYRGVKVGEVLRTDIDYEEKVRLLEPDSRIPILFKIEPGRLGYGDTEEESKQASDRIATLIRRGLHGEVKITNYLTGAQIIDLQHRPRRPNRLSEFASYPVIPATEGRVDQLLVLLERTVRKINDVPLDDVTEETLETLVKAQETLEHYERLASHYSAGSEPHRELVRSLSTLERTLAEVTPLIRQLREQPNSVVVGPRGEPDPEPTGAVP
ncbi:MAG TPA: hypothetical protein DFR83_14255 [Deltaproteobacteria bacterium]|nr:hypothetical protein [Deltaproteobacteria bacterium]